MSTLYLLSLFDDKITDVLYTTTAPITGSYVVRVPDDVVVKNPTGVSNLIAQKYASILAGMGLFGQVLYDDMLDTADINLVSSSGVTLGRKGMVSLYDGGVLTSTTSAFTWGGPGAAPSQAIVTWEVFKYEDTDDADAPYVRKYEEVSTSPATSPLTAEVSFNGGGTWTTVTDKNLVTIAAPDQGTSLVVRFTHDGTPSGRFFVGSWAVLF